MIFTSRCFISLQSDNGRPTYLVFYYINRFFINGSAARYFRSESLSCAECQSTFPTHSFWGPGLDCSQTSSAPETSSAAMGAEWGSDLPRFKINVIPEKKKKQVAVALKYEENKIKVCIWYINIYIFHFLILSDCFSCSRFVSLLQEFLHSFTHAVISPLQILFADFYQTTFVLSAPVNEYKRTSWVCSCLNIVTCDLHQGQRGFVLDNRHTKAWRSRILSLQAVKSSVQDGV